MKTKYTLTSQWVASLILLLLTFGSGPLVWAQSASRSITLHNDHISLSFNATNGTLLNLEELESGTLLAQSADPQQPLWRIKYQEGDGKKELNSTMAGQFEFSDEGEQELILEWSEFADFEGLEVRVYVTLPRNEPFSHWNMEWSYTGDQVIAGMDFPIVTGLREDEKSTLVVPEWMGSLITDPARMLSGFKPGAQKFSWVYPGILSMQFLGLAHADQTGFYAASHDPYTYMKNFEIALNENQDLTFQVSHFTDLKTKVKSFQTIYPVVLGSVPRDWVSMAYEYRKWGMRQSWSLNSRFANGQVPDWATNTALWVWNRGRSEGVLKPAVAMKERLGLPVNVLWHWWHGASYDDEFPDYLPPREGTDSFKEAVLKAREQGVRPLVYMNELQWGSTTESWKEEGAEAYAVKNEQGKLRTHVYNIFTGRPLTNMCITTPFWRNKYGGIAREAIKDLGVGGIYMDQACISRRCYDPDHGHEIGGGNYWAMYSGMLTEQIRTGVPLDQKPLLSGEGVCEAWLPYLDVFLALQVSRERYAGVGNWESIPLFQAVYHPYGIAYGNYSSLLHPPYDELWPDAHRPESALTLLPEKFNTQFLMEQARSFVWGMQPMISNYDEQLAEQRKEEIDFLMRMSRVRHQALKYLLHGTFMRPPDIVTDSMMVNISKLSIYAGQRETVTEFEKEYPVVYRGAWKAKDGSLGLPFANISSEDQTVSLHFETADYDLPGTGKLYTITESGRKSLGAYFGGNVQLDLPVKSRDVLVLEVVPEE